MSINGRDLINKFFSLFSFDDKDNLSRKRKLNDDHLNNSISKQRRIDDSIVNKLNYNDDRRFSTATQNTHMIPSRSKNEETSSTSYMGNLFTKPSSKFSNIPSPMDSSLEIEISDDEDVILVAPRQKIDIPVPHYTSSTPNGQMFSGQQYRRKSVLNNRKSTSSLIPKSVYPGPIPDLQPINKTHFSTIFNGFSKPKKSPLPTLNGSSYRRSVYCSDTKLTRSGRMLKAASETHNLEEKYKYAKLLQKLVPSLYCPASDSAIKRRPTPQRVVETINLDDGGPQVFIDLSDDDDGYKFSSLATETKQKTDESSSVIHIPDVEPVNSLRTKFATRPEFQENWLEKLNERYSSNSQERKKLIIDEEEKVQRLENNTKEQETLLIKKINDFNIQADTIILDEEEAEEEEALPELTNEHKTIVKKVIYGGPLDDVIITKFNLDIKRHDLNTLVGDSWLNDEVINFYMNLLMERSDQKKHHGLPTVYAMNTFFMPKVLQSGQAGVRRWTRKVDIFSYDIIPVPVHVGNVHWCMAIIHLKNKTIKYYDSMGQPNRRVLDALEQYLKDESMDKRKISINLNDWEKESVRDVPKQMNGSDCGVFSCMFAEFITRNREITFSQENMPYFRQKMILEIATGRLLL